MAKQTITYSCGHEGVESLFGPYKQRERRIEWLQSHGLCPECRKANKPAGRVTIDMDGDEVIVEVDGYELRQQLKDRGYRFDRDGQCWTRRLPSAEFAGEYAALTELGSVPDKSCREWIEELVK